MRFLLRSWEYNKNEHLINFKDKVAFLENAQDLVDFSSLHHCFTGGRNAALWADTFFSDYAIASCLIRSSASQCKRCRQNI